MTNHNSVLAVLTSGGDAPGMNAAVVAVTKTAISQGWTVLGVEDGYEGLMNGRWSVLNAGDVDERTRSGGTFLRTARSDRFRTPEGRQEAANRLQQASCQVLVVIGGNGSLTGALKLAEETSIRTIGIPASIDNDIACTSMCIGVDSAINSIVEACDKISDTARSHRRAFIVEVMGRECGYLAMASAIATSADAVLFREQGKTEDQLVSELQEVIRHAYSEQRGKNKVLIIKAEGVDVPTESLAKHLESTMKEDARGATLRYTILGHIVRGGRPSAMDRVIASRMGYAAAHLAITGVNQRMVGWRPYESGEPTKDPRVQSFDMVFVLKQTAQLLDGEHPTTKERISMLAEVQNILLL